MLDFSCNVLYDNRSSNKEMSKKMILNLIEAALAEFALEQVNLSSKEARKKLATRILERLSSEVYMTEYKSQDSFE